MKWDNMRKELESFAAMASSCRGGHITLEEFAHFLKLPVSSALEELFSLFDRVSVPTKALKNGVSAQGT